MNPRDFCPNCRKFILRSVDHRCSSNEDVNKQFYDDKVSTSALDNTVKGTKSHEETPSELTKGRNFSSSDNEEFQENTFKKAMDELENLKLLKKNPLISEGSTMSPTNEESSIEEGHEDPSEANRISAENQADVSGFLSIDTSLYSGEPDYIVSPYGNPLDGLPFEHLVADESNDSNQSKDKNAVVKGRQSISHDATTGKNRQNSCVTVSKSYFSGTFPPSFSGIHEHPSTSEGASFALPSDNQASPSKINRRRHSRSKSKIPPLKQSSQKSQRYDKSAITRSDQKSDETLITLHDHPYASGEASSTLASGRKACPSRPDYSKHSKAELKPSPSKHSPEKSHCHDKSTITCSTQKSEKALMTLHDQKYGSEKGSSTLPSGSPSGTSGPHHSGRSRTISKKSSLKQSSEQPFLCDRCGKIYGNRRKFKNRTKLHSDEKPFVCKECGKAFVVKPYLQRHFRQHSRGRKFKCEICGRTFVNQSNCCTHRRRHTK